MAAWRPKKWTAPTSELDTEATQPYLMPTTQQRKSLALAYLETQNGDWVNFSKAEILGQRQDLNQMAARKFHSDWVRWLMGVGSEDDHERTGWGRQPLQLKFPEIGKYCGQFAIRKLEYEGKMMRLKSLLEKGSFSLPKLWMYFKYVTRGDPDLREDTEARRDEADAYRQEFLVDWDGIMTKARDNPGGGTDPITRNVSVGALSAGSWLDSIPIVRA